MAFQINTAPASANNAAAAGNNQWKAAAFVNVYLPGQGGKRVKVGALPLKADNRLHAKLIERLQESGASEAFLNAIEIDFQLIDNEREVDLGF